MTAAASTHGAVTRAEFESVTERVTVLEESRSVPGGATTEAGPELVTQSEFRLFKWLGAFAIATVLGGFGMLYQQTTDLRVEMRVLHSDLLQEMYTQISGVRDEISGVRREISDLREEMHTEIRGLREEMHTQIGGLREEMHKEHTEIRKEIGRTKGASRRLP